MKRLRIAVAAIGFALLVGCAPAASTDTGPGACNEPPTVMSQTPTVVLLSATGASVPSYEEDVETVLAAASDTGARILVSGVGDPTSTQSVLVNTVLVGDGNNTLERDRDLECKQNAVVDAVATLRATSSSGVYDVFSAVQTLEGNLTSTEGPVDVVILAPMASNGGSPDLADPDVVADPVSAINELATSGRIPDCTGWTFHVAGQGSELGAAHREFWRQYAQRCGGHLVAWTSRLTDFPGARTPLTAPDYALIDVQETGTGVDAHLGGDMLFDDNSDGLRDDAHAALMELLEVTQQTEGHICIVGHTDSRGNAEANIGLSERRARAVSDWLRERGTAEPRMTSIGVGETRPAVPDASTPEQHQANRRVTVTIGREDAAGGAGQCVPS